MPNSEPHPPKLSSVSEPRKVLKDIDLFLSLSAAAEVLQEFGTAGLYRLCAPSCADTGRQYSHMFLPLVPLLGWSSCGPNDLTPHCEPSLGLSLHRGGSLGLVKVPGLPGLLGQE